MNFLTLKPEAFGLDISDSSLKIAKLKERGGFLTLASFGEAEIAPGIVEKGKIQNEDSLVKIIKKALVKVRGEELKTNQVIASLPEEEAFLEVIQLPKMEEEELKEAVYLEAENYIPLSIEDVYLDFQVIPPVYNHLDHIDLLIAALPKKIIDSYVSCFKKAELQPQILEIESLAIARALIKNGVSPHPLLLIDLGANKTSFMIFSGYSLRFTRSVPLSAQDFTQTIAKELNISPQEAEELKVKFGLEKKYQVKIKNGAEKEVAAGRVFKLLSPLLNNLTEEIKKSLDYYQSHVFHEHLPPNNRGINKVLLCGGGANLKGLPEFLSLALKTPVELGNPWINILKTPPKEIPQLAFEKSLSFATALGLALRGITNH
jgi:type IV pilus assembly protein PilM